MFAETIKQTKIAFLMLALFTVLTGVIYPLLVTGLAQVFFPWQANGSLIEYHGKIIGSQLIGQFFDDPRYFGSRPSATNPFPYNASASAGSNMGPSNPIFLETIKERVNYFKSNHPEPNGHIPVDLVTASASGLDSEISPLAAFYQVHRISKLRNLSEKQVYDVIQHEIKKRTLILLGEPRVNVLALNLALDNLKENYAR